MFAASMVPPPAPPLRTRFSAAAAGSSAPMRPRRAPDRRPPQPPLQYWSWQPPAQSPPLAAGRVAAATCTMRASGASNRGARSRPTPAPDPGRRAGAEQLRAPVAAIQAVELACAPVRHDTSTQAGRRDAAPTSALADEPLVPLATCGVLVLCRRASTSWATIRRGHTRRHPSRQPRARRPAAIGLYFGSRPSAVRRLARRRSITVSRLAEHHRRRRGLLALRSCCANGSSAPRRSPPVATTTTTTPPCRCSRRSAPTALRGSPPSRRHCRSALLGVTSFWLIRVPAIGQTRLSPPVSRAARCRPAGGCARWSPRLYVSRHLGSRRGDRDTNRRAREQRSRRCLLPTRRPPWILLGGNRSRTRAAVNAGNASADEASHAAAPAGPSTSRRERQTRLLGATADLVLVDEQPSSGGTRRSAA